MFARTRTGRSARAASSMAASPARGTAMNTCWRTAARRGGGGREHALAWKIAASPLTTKLWCAPGNAGIAHEAECVPVDLTDHAAVVALCKRLAVDFVVVGPDNPLVAGIVDDIEAAGFRTFGPTKAAARLEGSKGFTKDLCKRYGIPTAAYEW